MKLTKTNRIILAYNSKGITGIIGGYEFEYFGFTFQVYKYKLGWFVCEKSTHRFINLRDNTRKLAIEVALRECNRVGKKKLAEQVKYYLGEGAEND